MKRTGHQSRIGIVKMEASKESRLKGGRQPLSGLEHEPLDELANEIIEESPQIIPDMREALRVLHENGHRLGISPDYEVRGSIDPEYPELKKIGIWIHVGKETGGEESIAIWDELTRLKLSRLHDRSSIGRIIFIPVD